MHPFAKAKALVSSNREGQRSQLKGVPWLGVDVTEPRSKPSCEVLGQNSNMTLTSLVYLCRGSETDPDLRTNPMKLKTDRVPHSDSVTEIEGLAQNH